MSSYKKRDVKEHPHRKRLKQLDKAAWASGELAKELAKNNPSWQAIIIAEIKQRLGIV